MDFHSTQRCGKAVVGCSLCQGSCMDTWPSLAGPDSLTVASEGQHHIKNILPIWEAFPVGFTPKSYSSQGNGYRQGPNTWTHSHSRHQGPHPTATWKPEGV